ncbi:unnamed protein product, partial [Aureobasidium pullulans]
HDRRTNERNQEKSLRHLNNDPDEDAPPSKKPKAPSTTTSSRNASQNTPTMKRMMISLSRVLALERPKQRHLIRRQCAHRSYTTAQEEAQKDAAHDPEPATRRRSKRLSGNSPVHDQAPVTSKPASESQSQQTNPATPPPAPEIEENSGCGSRRIDDTQKRGPAKIPLPFGETPVLRRNKEMRKMSAEKSRRSSSGMRGRRASSLIEAGSSRETRLNHADFDLRRYQNDEHEMHDENRIFKIEEANWNFSMDTAVPHNQVETNEFYKHISQTLVEPKRMRQLLMWCGHRALPEKSGGGQMDAAETAAMHAVIGMIERTQRQLYWSKAESEEHPKRREVAAVGGRACAVTRRKTSMGRPLNLNITTKGLDNASRNRSFVITNATRYITNSHRSLAIRPLTSRPTPNTSLGHLLNSSEPSTTPAPTSTIESTKQRIGTIASTLEFKIDKLADGAHKLEQYRAGAQRLADHVLSVGAEKLEERDKSVREKSSAAIGGQVDPLERLRGLSRVLNKRG